MILSRRSFLKLAGLTTVAAASASMFTGCGAFSTTPIKVVAAKDSTKEFQAAVTKLNEKKLVVWPADANGAYLNSFLMSNLTANGLSGFAVEKAEYKTATDAETGKEYKYLEVTVKSTAK
ncbi:twin-arginine translocation signal domain-containing protein [Faecalibacterium taiwanense]|uniref:twin-arginine translocation signal domain-containing protein n=1 Tax=Faecalibacterium taiwanense TaxID=3030638 RepID=UPI003AADBE61